MILKKKWIIEYMHPTFHRYGTRRVLVYNLAEPGETRPRLVPTPTTTPISGWVLTYAVSAKPSTLFAPCCNLADEEITPLAYSLRFALRGEHPLGTCFRLWAYCHKPKGCANKPSRKA